jgi:thiamine kinase-like enzyme
LDALYAIPAASLQTVDPGPTLSALIEQIDERMSSALIEANIRRLWERWFDGDQGDLLRSLKPDVVGRGDPNLANCLWNGSNMAFVDFEYGGRANRVVEMANLLEHPQSLATDEGSWADFLGMWGFDDAERRALHCARIVMGFYWTSRFTDRPAERAVHRRRVEALVSAAAPWR